MHIRDTARLALRSLTINKRRALLTMLGIVIGITAVVVIVSVGAGAQSLIVNQISSIGSNLVGILPGAADENGPPASAMGVLVTTLTDDDALAIGDRSRVPHVTAVAPYVRGAETISWQNRTYDGAYIGTGAEYPQVEDVVLTAGRFFTLEEEKTIGRVAVLGSEVAAELFQGRNPVDEKIKIKRETFTVIGVLEERGVSGFQSQDNIVLIPVSSAQKLLLGINHLGFIRARVDTAENVDRSMEDIKVLLRERHDIDDPADDDFSVRSTADALDALLGITNGLKFFLAAIAAIALVVGGIGIMNIMYVTVTERTREIGLRKAVGARGRDVLVQFLYEAVQLTFVGGLVGVACGASISWLVAVVARYLGYQWDLVVSWQSIVLACGVCIAIGVLFGYYPARRAAELDPITALRYE